jgi:IclR family pca regulon transcriptional regulator
MSARNTDPSVSGSGSRYEVVALTRGLRILTEFSSTRRQLRLTDLANATGLPTPTVYRLLRTLEEGGYVERLPSGTFRPGAAALMLGFATLQGLDLVDVASLPLQRLADETGETVNMGVLTGSKVLYLIRLRNTDLVTADLHVGSTLPAACSSMGKILLASRPREELESLVTQLDLSSAAGPNAIRTIAALLGELELVRSRGWAAQDEEVAVGLRSVAGAITDHSGQVVASANIAVQAPRWSQTDLVAKLLPRLLECCQDVSRRLP